MSRDTSILSRFFLFNGFSDRVLDRSGGTLRKRIGRRTLNARAFGPKDVRRLLGRLLVSWARLLSCDPLEKVSVLDFLDWGFVPRTLALIFG